MSRLRKSLLAAALLVLAPLAVHAQVGSISGTVSDSNGDPVAGALIFATDPSSPAFFTFNIGFSDVNGDYSIQNVAPGTYDVTADRFGFDSAFGTVTVVSGQDSVLDLTLTAPMVGSVVGVITDADTGAPIEGAFVSLTPLNPPAGTGPIPGISIIITQATTTDANGAYELLDVGAGDYDVEVDAFNYVGNSTSVTVMDGVTSTADVALDPLANGDVTGVVTDAMTGDPIEGAFVVLLGDPSGGFLSFFTGIAFTTTDATGAYSFLNTPTGTREIQISAFGYEDINSTVDVTDGNTTVADFSLDALGFGTVTGTVTDAGGQPVANAWVIIGGGGFARTDAAGSYTIDMVESGTQFAFVWAIGFPFASQSVDVVENQTTTLDWSL